VIRGAGQAAKSGPANRPGRGVCRGRAGRSVAFGVRIAAFALLTAVAGVGTARGFPVGGYFKSFAIFLNPPAYKLDGSWIGQPDMGSVDNKLRLKLSLDLSSLVAFDAAYEISPRIQDRRLWANDVFFPGLEPSNYRLADLRSLLYPGGGRTPESFGVYQNLDRLSFAFKPRAATFIVGRQAVAWGSARVINPTDILAPFAFDTLDKEERLGIDAVRVRVPLGVMDELDMGVVAGRDLAAVGDAFFVRGRTHQLETDIAGTVMAFRGHLMLGLDVARSIGGAGAWLEAAYVLTDALGMEGALAGRNYFRASAGLDYNFSGKTYGFVEYHFNSAGASDPAEYLGLLATPAYRDGADYLLGRHYASVGTTYQITPLLPFTGLAIVNLNDLSLVVAPAADYNVAENVYLAAGAYMGIGKRPELAGGVPPPDPVNALVPGAFRSEFGAYPGLVYVSFRIYF